MHFYPTVRRLVWPAAALVVGLAIGGWWPTAALHAVATDSNPTCIVATGLMDPSVEAVFVLDTLTGDLKAGVLSKRGQKFTAQYQRNILKDFGLEEGKKPQFLMVTGISDLARVPGGVRPSSSAVYVAEITTGVLCAYTVPWAPELHTKDQPIPGGQVLPAGIWQFRTAKIREQ
jgi:hypothetical protein